MLSIRKIFKGIIFINIILFQLLFVSGCGKEVSRSPVESEVPQGFIHISSIPEGFTIYLDGRNTGRLTPDSISYIDAGVYNITLNKKYYNDTSVVETLNENEKAYINIDITSNPSMYGWLYLQTTPSNASIILNDSTLNKLTPTTLLGLLPGEYRIKFSLLNYRSNEIIGIVQSSKVNSYIEELRDTSVWVDYQIFNSGIVSNSLTAIAIDNNNIKWIGAFDKGLIRYDEVNFINYNLTNSPLPSNTINCIAVDNQNRVWAGTDKGIGVFDGNGWNVYDENNTGLTSSYINIIRFDDIGNVWIGTSSNLVKFDGISWTLYNDPLGRDWVQDFYIENQNKIWIGSRSFGIFILQDNTYYEINKIIYNYPSYSISSMSVDKLENLWFCFYPDTSGRGGASYWNGNSFSNRYLGTSQNFLNNIFVDDENNKWISSTEGLYLLDNLNSPTLFNTLNSQISANNVRAALRDKNGNVWITTAGGGLNKYKPPQ